MDIFEGYLRDCGYQKESLFYMPVLFLFCPTNKRLKYDEDVVYVHTLNLDDSLYCSLWYCTTHIQT